MDERTGRVIMNKDDIEEQLQIVYSDIELIRNQRIYEIADTHGAPKCSTLAKRLKSNIKGIVDDYESLIKDQKEAVEQEQFELLFGLLSRLVSEIAELSKKHPDDLVNVFKVEMINKVLIPLKDIMSDEPVSEYLLTVTEVVDDIGKSRNSYSDVVLILSQYREACAKYKKKHYDFIDYKNY